MDVIKQMKLISIMFLGVVFALGLIVASIGAVFLGIVVSTVSLGLFIRILYNIIVEDN
jgi:hypothetical protein